MSVSAVSPYGGNNASGAIEQPPKFLSNLEVSTESVEEGEPVRLEVQVSKETDLQVDWCKDGRPISAGSRFNTSMDRGIASMDILYTFPEDSGIYTCTIANRAGQIQSNPIQLTVIAEDATVDDSLQQQFDQFMVQNQNVIEREDRSMCKEAPQFLTNVTVDPAQVAEGKPARFEAQLNVGNDSSLSVDWFKDGKPIGTGSRFNTIVDRGYVLMEIAYCKHEDSGQYVCRAKNALGQIESTPVQLLCQAEELVVTKSILDESSIQHLKALEEPGDEHAHCFGECEAGVGPSFQTALTPESLEIIEDQPVELTANVDAGNGNLLVVEWKKDGQIVKNSSRINGTLEMGIACLRIRYAQPGDSGVYTCHVKSEHGQADSNPSHITCQAEGSIITSTQLVGDKVKGMQAIETLEAVLNAPKESAVDDEGPMGAPEIIRQPQPVGEVEEGAPVHFEVVVEPAQDPNMHVEWFKGNKPLSSGTRFRVEYERGVATLDLLHTIQEDSDIYWCRAYNGSGECLSEKIPVQCSGVSAVITQSNLMQGSDGIKLIQAIEGVGAESDFVYEEEVEPDSIPVFDVKPQPQVVAEGANAKLLVRISGKPEPQVQWTINGETIKTDSIVKIYNDGAINYLEINRCPLDPGSYSIKISASNAMGNAEAETSLTVTPSEDFRPGLKHVKPENQFKKLMTLKKVQCSDELCKALHKTKLSAQDVNCIDRTTELKAKTYKSPEVIEAENMLDKMATHLRKSEIKRPLAQTQDAA